MTTTPTPPNTLHVITPHVAWYSPDERTDRPSLALVMGTNRAVMLDIGASPAHTHGFLEAIRAQGLPAPTFALLTHWHWDHSFGADALQIPIIAHTETSRQLAVQAGYDWSDSALDERVAKGLEIAFCRDMLKLELPDRSQLRLRVPDITFTDTLTLDLGGVQCHIRHVGGDHAADASVMYIPEDGVLFMGDCLYDNIYAPVRHYTASKTRTMLDRLADMPATQMILGHHSEVQRAGETQGWMKNLRILSDLVAQHGNQPPFIQTAFQTALGRSLNEDDLSDMQAMLAGLPSA